MLDRLDHLVVAVADLDQAADDYECLLGRRPSWRGEHRGAGTANVLFGLDNTYVELLADAGDGAVGDWVRHHLDTWGEGLAALAFGTDDAAACQQAWVAQNLVPGPLQPGSGQNRDTGAERRWTSVMLPPAVTRGVAVFAIEHEGGDASLDSAPASTGPDAAVAALDHVVVLSQDADATRAVYGDALGLRLALDQTRPEWNARQLFFRVGGVTVEVGAALDQQADPAARDQLWGLAWTVPDVEAAHTRIAGTHRVSEVRNGRKPGTSVFSVKDRSGGVPTLMIGRADQG